MLDTVLPDLTAYYAGMQKGDSIVAIAEVPTPCYYLMTQELKNHPCDSVTIAFYRANEPMTARVFLGDQ